jgi:hypothetical protein
MNLKKYLLLIPLLLCLAFPASSINITDFDAINEAYIKNAWFVSSYGFADHGDKTKEGTLAWVIKQIGNDKGFVILPPNATYKLATPITVPSNVQLQMSNSAVISKVLGSSATLTINGPFDAGLYQVFSGFSAGNVTFGGAVKEVYPQWWAVAGTVDWTAAIEAAIDASNGKLLVWPSGTYSISSAISKTLTGISKWMAVGPVTIKWTGSSVSNAIVLELAGYDFSIDGITFDGNNTAAVPIRINNDQASMASAATLSMRDVKFINAYSDVNSRSAYGCFLYGAFDLIKIDRPYVYNINRAAGLTGSPASQGISISHKSTTVYARSVIITDPYIDTVTAADAVGDGTYIDMDGICVVGSAANDNGGVKMDTSLIIRGGTFLNCYGRSIKSQMESNLVDGPTIIKDSSMTKRAMTSATEIDFQYGSGVAINGKVRYGEISGGGTPFSVSHAIVNATVRGYATEEGALVVKNWEVTNNVAQATDLLPYFVTAVRTGGTFQSAIVENNTFLGVGAVEELIHQDGANIKLIVANNNYVNDLGTSLIYSPDDYSSAIVYAKGNFLLGTAKALTDGGSNIPVFYGENTGFTVAREAHRKGATSVADGGTITHYMGVAPSIVTCTPSVTGEFVSVTAIGASDFTVAIKKHDNSAGTTQTIYWQAFK